MSRLTNIHATSLALGRYGLLIMGASGSGKTTLALHLIEQMTKAGRFGRLVCDDQTLITSTSSKLLAQTPSTIAGQIEIHGLGPRPIPHLGCAIIDLIVQLQPDAPRFQDGETLEIAGVSVPLLRLPQRNIAQSAVAIRTHLGLNDW